MIAARIDTRHVVHTASETHVSMQRPLLITPTRSSSRIAARRAPTPKRIDSRSSLRPRFPTLTAHGAPSSPSDEDEEGDGAPAA